LAECDRRHGCTLTRNGLYSNGFSIFCSWPIPNLKTSEWVSDRRETPVRRSGNESLGEKPGETSAFLNIDGSTVPNSNGALAKQLSFSIRIEVSSKRED
jgi:hypothetical protein